MDKIFDKIKKLLRLAESDNPHEAESAMQKANDLMKEYSISASQVSDTPDSGNAKHEIVLLNTSSDWALLLAWYVCGAFGVMAVSSGTEQVKRGRSQKMRATKKMFFFGTDAKIQTTKIMVQFAIDAVERVCKAERKRVQCEATIYDSYGRVISVRKYMSSFRKGVVNGMGITLKAIKTANENKNAEDQKDRQYAMVCLSDNDKAKAERDEMFPNLGTHKARQTGDRGIYNNGSSAGQKVGFNKQAGAGGVRGFLK